MTTLKRVTIVACLAVLTLSACRKPENAAKLTPDDVLITRKCSELQDRARQYAKQKREQIGIQQ